MKAIFVLVTLIAATAVAFYVVWMNRASEKIVTTVIPIAIVALVGVLIAVFVFGGEPPVVKKFPVVFLFRRSDKAPWTPPDRPLLMSLFEVPELMKTHPELMGDNTEGATLYHHLLQRAMIDIIARHHRSSWETDIERFEIGSGTQEFSAPVPGATEPNVKVSFDQIKEALKGNRFAESPYMRPELALPVGTSLTVTVPTNNGSGAEEGQILLTNDFVRLSIKTQQSMWSRSLGGYRLILGYSYDQDQEFATTQYLVSVEAEFSRLRSGHPKMSKYRRWVEQMVSEIQTELDEQVVWSKTRDTFLFRKQLQQFGSVEVPVRPLTLNAPEYK
jgi:hypothetical protein